jgi:predicted ATPase/DNA-binding CsgD family transcriptional regulator
LIDAFPPLRSLDAAANNLPVQLTSFVGRKAEMDAINELLGERRLVTLIGAGGCGKTRLALQVAAGRIDDYPDGAWWIDLAPLADPSLVPAALAGVLGVRESPVEPITDTVVGYLSARRALVGLDNCEHLIEACAALAARLVQGCPGVTLIATSREPLRIDGEATWPVPSLSLPETPAVDSLARSESVRLFVDRARAPQPKFAITERNAPAVAEICSRLDGIPLAIELAAARTRVLAVDDIAAGLADRFHLLTGGARSALPRQRTLEASVDWSHDMLDDAERIVFRRLSAFAGSFTLEAAEAVCSGEGVAPEQVLDLLSGLLDRSLVQVADEGGKRTRYRLLETIRDYARRKLTDAAENEAVRDRHLDFYVAFTEQAAAGMEGPDLIAWLARVDKELDNFRAALDWSPRSSRPIRGQRLVGLLTLYWFARSEQSIGRSRLEATLDDGMGDGPERAGALSALCMVAYRGADMVAARRYGDEAVAIARTLGDARTLGRALHWRAWVRYWGEGDRFGAWADFEEAAELLRGNDDRLFQALNLALLAFSYTTTSEAPRARALLTEGLALTDGGAGPHARSYCLGFLGFVETLEGDFEDAPAHFDEALALAQVIGDPYAEILTRMCLAIMDSYRGRHREGCDLVERGLATALEHRSPNGEAFMRYALGSLAFAEARLDIAASELEASFEILGAPMPMMGAICRSIQAQVAVEQSRLADARRYAAEALSLGLETDTVGAIAWGLSAQASLARVEGDPHRAEDLLHDALDHACGVGWRPAVCEILDALAGAVALQGRFEEAARLLGAAQGLRDSIGIPRFPVHEPSHEADSTMVREALGAEAFDEAWADGAALTLDDAVAYARRGRGKRRRPTHGWNSLTPTEIRVVELVAQGLTNPQVGEKLFVSARTVQTHLIHVFAKLGVSTRAELAAKTAQRQGTST